MNNRQAFSVINLDFELFANTESGDNINLREFMRSFRITKTVATWFTQVEVVLDIPVEIFYKLIPLSDLTFSLTIYFKHNTQILQTYTCTLITYSSNIQNMMHKDHPARLSLILVPMGIKSLLEGFDCYIEGSTSLQSILSLVLQGVQIQHISPCNKSGSLYDVFIPYMPRVKALAYCLREFGCSDDLYTFYQDCNGLKLFLWSELKDRYKDFIIEILPSSYQFKYAYVIELMYLERTDVKLRINEPPKLIQQRSTPINDEVFTWTNKGNNMPNPPKTSLDSVYPQTLTDSNIIKGLLIPKNELFPFDLLHPLKVTSNETTFSKLLGTYAVTDISLYADLTQSNVVPYLEFHAIQRN